MCACSERVVAPEPRRRWPEPSPRIILLTSVVYVQRDPTLGSSREPRVRAPPSRSIDLLIRFASGFGPYTSALRLYFSVAARPRARVFSPAPRGDRPRIRRASRVAHVQESVCTYDTVSSRAAGDPTSAPIAASRARRPGLAPGWWATATFIFRGADARSPRLPLPAAARRRAARRAVGSRQDSTARRRARPVAAAAPSRRRSSTPRAVAGSTPETAAPRAPAQPWQTRQSPRRTRWDPTPPRARLRG